MIEKPSNSHRALSCAIGALLVVSGACHAVAPAGGVSEAAEPSQAPVDSAAILSDPSAVERGSLTFVQHCAYCHGAGGSGGKARELIGRSFRDSYLFKTITNGKKRGAMFMPPWKRSLSEEQRCELVAYIQSIAGERR